jgi:cysteine-rich repeat protein
MRWAGLSRCFSYTCLKRLMTFWSIVATGKIYTVHFSGSAPQNMRFHLLNSIPTEKLILRIFFESSVRMQVFVGSRFVEDVNLFNGKPKAQLVIDGKWAPNTDSGGYAEQQLSLTCPCLLESSCLQACDTSSNQHGANRYDRSSGYLEIVLVGHSIDSFIEIKAMPVVQVSMTVSTSKQDFYKIKDAFLSSLASILGINPTRITVVDIVAGRRRSRQLLSAGAAISLEIAPDPVIGFKQSTGSLAVLSNAGFVNITITRTVNIIPNCSVWFKVGLSPLSTAVAGLDFVTAEYSVTFLSLEVEKIVSVPILNMGYYRLDDATFEVSLSQPGSASLGISTLTIAVQCVTPPAPLPPVVFNAPTETKLSFQWNIPEWPNKPEPDLSLILKWGIMCKWNNTFRSMSGNISEVMDSNGYLDNNTMNHSITSLAPATEASCQVRMQTAGGWSVWSQPGTPLKTLSICGNSFREWSQSEECDDGNLLDQDGCNWNCTVTRGWSCKEIGGRSACSSGCGNGNLQGNEVCDDGNSNSGDGCSVACVIEVGWACTAQSSNSQIGHSVCNTTCGDGILVGSTEQCDDGNLLGGDGCSSSCLVEAGAVCTVDLNMKSVCQTCGNHKLEGSEACDDGWESGACASDCRSVTLGWKCNDVCVAGPSPVHKPLSPSQTSSSITWIWSLPNGNGLPVRNFVCRLAPAVYGPDGNITVNWTALSVYNMTSDQSQKQQQLVTSNLSVSTAFIFQVSACSSVGCSPFGMSSPIVETLPLPQQNFGQIGNLLQGESISQVLDCLSCCYKSYACNMINYYCCWFS